MKALFAAALLALPLLARAQVPLQPEDARAVREVIEAQLDAFRHDDAARAFSYAAPDIQKAFGTPERFMAMVRTSYPVVYRPRSVLFEPPSDIDGDVFQPVRLTDSDGHAWMAVYPMERGADGVWRINGCQLGRLRAEEI